MASPATRSSVAACVEDDPDEWSPLVSGSGREGGLLGCSGLWVLRGREEEELGCGPVCYFFLLNSFVSDNIKTE